MKNIKIVYVIVALIIGAIFFYSLKGGKESKEDYSTRINKERKEKDRFMRISDESPFSEKMKKTFKGLDYFPPNQKFRINARLIPIGNQSQIELPTSSGQNKVFTRYAYAEFKWEGKLQNLLLLRSEDEEDPKKLFLIFSDATSGEETYGAGRYIDLELKQKNQIEIDFNKAYNPYCNYNYSYSCPFPPKENQLKVAIRAGEKTYENND
ncbi:DUF1684 domain-containing protein [Xanthovirga aplysinae]|uniref:DUF1684 domain-containing protein n=1 Tax=Xanthovirga aplysinae TaxID=2529853 RepID=UPI0012BC70F6|nr:DUF1684 domain-containing protein [Xanthovirga aplysinae]MTI32982.1 DUF1684 domain-containing protein [Xanthovirga aplysinae]